jgi:hypothetical protein
LRSIYIREMWEFLKDRGLFKSAAGGIRVGSGTGGPSTALDVDNTVMMMKLWDESWARLRPIWDLYHTDRKAAARSRRLAKEKK